MQPSFSDLVLLAIALLLVLVVMTGEVSTLPLPFAPPEVFRSVAAVHPGRSSPVCPHPHPGSAAADRWTHPSPPPQTLPSPPSARPS